MHLALQAGGLSDIKLQHLVLTLRNRTIHTCDSTNVCNALEINIELISFKGADGDSRVEHYPSPYVDFQKTCNIGLVNNHYFINGTTYLSAYSLEHYDKVKDIVDCRLVYKGTGNYYNKHKSGKRFIKSFQVFKLLKHNICKLIRPMPLT